jgi:hypothetical protein
MLEIGIVLMFLGVAGLGTRVILESIEEEDDPLEIPGQLKRLGSSKSLAGMNSPDKDAYIRHLQAEVTRLSGQPAAPAWTFTGGVGDAGDAKPENLVRTSITSPSPHPITPQNHPKSPGTSPLESPPLSPDFVINFPVVDLPFDAPSSRQKCHELILRGMTKSEVLEEVWGLTRSDKTGRTDSKYARCSKLFDEIKADAENQIKEAARNKIEFMGQI